MEIDLITFPNIHKCFFLLILKTQRSWVSNQNTYAYWNNALFNLTKGVDTKYLWSRFN